jgi:hypothetical protein
MSYAVCLVAVLLLLLSAASTVLGLLLPTTHCSTALTSLFAAQLRPISFDIDENPSSARTLFSKFEDVIVGPPRHTLQKKKLFKCKAFFP